MQLLGPEQLWVWGGLSSYAAATTLAWYSIWARRACEGVIWLVVFVGVLLLAGAISMRWHAVGYGPFFTLYEVLLSNLFSLGLIYVIVCWLHPLAAKGGVFALAVLMMLAFWLTRTSPEANALPATYQSHWLWVHILFGKVFLGLALVSTGLSVRLLLQGVARLRQSVKADAMEMDILLWRLMGLAFVFHSLMLIAGAVWAQDAWGRYWAWDPLETWALTTWLALGFALHARITFKAHPRFGWVSVIGVFVLAFLTFFGVPFFSLAPHKGIV